MAEPVNMQYISDISNALSSLATTLFVRGKLNLTDSHVMSEGFYEGLLNLMYDLNLHNTNSDQQNTEGIDLVDTEAKIIMQVTATCNKSKIDHSLSELKPEYAGFHFIFVPVTIKDTKSQRAHQYNAPHNIVFDPKKDIYDIPFLVREFCVNGLSGTVVMQSVVWFGASSFSQSLFNLLPPIVEHLTTML